MRTVKALAAGLLLAAVALPAHADPIPNTPTTTPAIGGVADVLTTSVAIYGGERRILVGGKFDSVGGASSPNAAILSLTRPGVVVQTLSANDIVKGTYARSVLYFVGNFTTFQGQGRQYAAAVDLAGNLLPWNPKPAGKVNTIAVSADGVHLGTSSGLYTYETATSNKTGKLRWSKAATTGSVRALTLNPAGTALYAGGLFEALGGHVSRVVKLNPSTGAIDTAYRSPLAREGGDGSGTRGDCVLSFTWWNSGRLVIGSGGSGRNGFFVTDPNTGGVQSSTNWAYVFHPNPEHGSVLGSPPPYQNRIQRNSEGDVQALAMVGSSIVMGYHRNHVNYALDWKTKRFTTSWTTSTGRVEPWDPGLYGCSGTTASNCGVSALTYDPVTRLLVVGGAFKGWGDPYNDTGGTDILGAPGTRGAALLFYKVP